MAEKYKLVFTGQIQQGYTTQQVKENLAKLYKLPVQKFENWFSGKPIVIKEQEDLLIRHFS